MRAFLTIFFGLIIGIFIICGCKGNKTEKASEATKKPQTVQSMFVVTDTVDVTDNPWHSHPMEFTDYDLALQAIRERNDSFIPAEYKQWKHFDLWKMKPYGKVDVDTQEFVYVKQTDGFIRLRLSSNPNKLIVIQKRNNHWLYDDVDYRSYGRIYRRSAYIKGDTIIDLFQIFNKDSINNIILTTWSHAYIMTKNELRSFNLPSNRPYSTFNKYTYDSVMYEINKVGATKPKWSEYSEFDRDVNGEVEDFWNRETGEGSPRRLRTIIGLGLV